MTLNCFQISAGRKLTACSYEQAIEESKNPDAKVWVDVQGGSIGELQDLLNKFDVRDLARRLCLDARERPGFYPLNTWIFMVIPIQAEESDFRDVEYITLLCRQNLLITFRNPRSTRLQEITSIQETADWLPNESIAGFVSAFMMVLTIDSLQRLTELKDIITALEKRMDTKPSEVRMNEISDQRSKLLTLEAVVSGQLPSFQALMATDKPFFKLDATREHMISALANLKAADRSIHWLEGRVDVLRSAIEMLSQDKMNRRLSRLTILSLIFMPMTFMAGIWGMNFNNMPELGSPYGYPVALGSMVLVGSMMFFYFRRRGWFE